MAHTSADAGGSKCAKGLVLLAVLGLRVGWSRKEIVKRNDLYIKDTSRKLRLTTTRRWRRKVMSEPPTMPLVRRFGNSHMPVWNQPRFGRSQIRNYWLAFRRSSFLTTNSHAMPCFCQLTHNSRIVRDPGTIRPTCDPHQCGLRHRAIIEETSVHLGGPVGERHHETSSQARGAKVPPIHQS